MTVEVATLVVGGGIGGLATALAVARAGHPVRLLERAEDFTEIGAGLQVGPNASRAMDALGLLDDITDLAVQPRTFLMMDAMSGARLSTLDLGPAFRDRYHYPYLVMHRSDLLGVLLEHCRAHPLITLETRKTVVEADISDDGALVSCADGSHYLADQVIAADGLHSTLRRYVVDDQAVCSGYAAYRGTIPMADMAVERAAGPIAPDDVVLWIGPGLHLMQYPVRRGELYNQVAVFRSERFHRGHTGMGEWGGTEELDAAFARTSPPVRRAVGEINRERFWAMFDRTPVDRWTRGSLLLTGDAAHPMLQYLGQGACQALEDAVELGRQFGRHGRPDGVDRPAAYADFTAARMGRAARCQTSARPWGDLWHTDDPLTVAVRNRLFTHRAATDYAELDWLYAPGPLDQVTPAPRDRVSAA